MTSRLAASFSALSDRSFRRFALGQMVSQCGTWLQRLAQAWLVLTLTDSGLLLGVVAACQQVPTLFVTALGGALADKYQKRLLLFWTALVSAMPALFLGIVVQLGIVQVWMVMVAALVQGVADAIEKPSRHTFVNDLATPENLPNAVTLNGMIMDSGKILGPALGGVLIGSVGLGISFFVNAASFVPVMLVLLLMPRTAVPEAHRRPAGGGFGEAIEYARDRPELASALGLMAVTGLLAYNWTVIIPVLMRESFGGDASIVGFGFTSLGLGGIIGGLVIAGSIRATSRRQIIAALLFGLMFLVVGLAPTLTSVYVALFALGAASVNVRSTTNALVQVSADPWIRGRVMALYVLAMSGTTPFGGPLQGWLSETFGPRWACLVAASGTIAAATLAHRYLRRRTAGVPIRGRRTAEHSAVEPGPSAASEPETLA